MEGDRLIMELAPPRSLLWVLASLSPREGALPIVADTPPSPVEL
jgi:hypothetical protein